MQRYTICEIDLAAIRHNVGVMKAHVAGGAKFLAVVKANAYGHGALPVARDLNCLGGADSRAGRH